MFEMDPAVTRAGLEAADTSAAAQPSALPNLRIGYAAPLLHAVAAVHAARAAQIETLVAANAVRREASVAAVETTEAANAATLSC